MQSSCHSQSRPSSICVLTFVDAFEFLSHLLIGTVAMQGLGAAIQSHAGCHFEGGRPFELDWLVQNTGTVPWADGAVRLSPWPMVSVQSLAVTKGDTTNIDTQDQPGSDVGLEFMGPVVVSEAGGACTDEAPPVSGVPVPACACGEVVVVSTRLRPGIRNTTHDGSASGESCL